MSELIETYRIVTFVPEEVAEEFIAAITPHIPHLFGNYDSVAWWSEPKLEHGTEQYRERKDAAEIKQEPSVRIELSIPKDETARDQLITDIITPNHPWQEPVILVFEAQIVQ